MEHLDGHTYVIENSGVTKPGAVMSIAGEGMPAHNNVRPLPQYSSIPIPNGVGLSRRFLPAQLCLQQRVTKCREGLWCLCLWCL